MQYQYGRASTEQELEQILLLQQRNLLEHVSHENRKTEGFVSIQHDLAILSKMNEVCPHIIATDGKKVVGYALCMHPKFADEIELLRPMFLEIDSAVPPTESFVAMGQICIDKDHRKKGIFRELYKTMKAYIQPEFDCIVTSVDTTNTRSLEAHYAVGFTDLKTFRAKNRDWKLILLK